MIDFLFSFWNLVPVTLSQSLLYAFVALGIMIPFRILNFPDLTSEGAFPLGGCLCAALILGGASPFLATAGAVLGGFLAGCATSLIHLKLRINTLLAGILMITMLWSINLRVMGSSNTPLFTEPNVFDLIRPGFTREAGAQIVFWVALSIGVVAALRIFLHTEAGLALRAVGANDRMARAQGIDVWSATIVGVGVANAFNALAGACLAQIQGYADVAMGFGILINGLAALIIGEAITGRGSVLRQVAAPFVGSILYYQAISVGLAAGVNPSDLKLVTALFVLATLAFSGAGHRMPGTERRIRA